MAVQVRKKKDIEGSGRSDTKPMYTRAKPEAVKYANRDRSSQTEQQRQSPRSTGQQIRNASYGTKTKLNMETKSRNTRKILQDAFKKKGK